MRETCTRNTREGNKTVVSPRDEKSEARGMERKRAALWPLGRVKTNISLRDAVKLRSMQRQASTMQQPWTAVVTRGERCGNTPVEIHRVLCGNNTRQNERPVRCDVSPRFSKNIPTAKPGFKREAARSLARFTRRQMLEIRAEWGQLFPTAAR